MSELLTQLGLTVTIPRILTAIRHAQNQKCASGIREGQRKCLHAPLLPVGDGGGGRANAEPPRAHPPAAARELRDRNASRAVGEFSWLDYWSQPSADLQLDQGDTGRLGWLLQSWDRLPQSG